MNRTLHAFEEARVFKIDVFLLRTVLQLQYIFKSQRSSSDRINDSTQFQSEKKISIIEFSQNPFS
jgi:hypothetical protein